MSNCMMSIMRDRRPNEKSSGLVLSADGCLIVIDVSVNQSQVFDCRLVRSHR